MNNWAHGSSQVGYNSVELSLEEERRTKEGSTHTICQLRWEKYLSGEIVNVSVFNISADPLVFSFRWRNHLVSLPNWLLLQVYVNQFRIAFPRLFLEWGFGESRLGICCPVLRFSECTFWPYLQIICRHNRLKISKWKTKDPPQGKSDSRLNSPKAKTQAKWRNLARSWLEGLIFDPAVFRRKFNNFFF